MGFTGYGGSTPEGWRNFIHNQGPAFYILAAVFFGLAIYAMIRIPGKTTTYNASLRESAWTACTTFVEQERGIAAAGAEKYGPAKVTLLSDDSVHVDVNYAQSGVFYRCTLQRAADGSWQLTALEEQ